LNSLFDIVLLIGAMEKAHILIVNASGVFAHHR
jgi:hypothetical protein